MQKEPSYSVILPVYNEAGNLARLIDEINTAIAPSAGERYEIIAVDDCSTDDSLNQLRQIEANNPRLRIITHRMNCGQSAALVSGLRAARGDIIITMDADGQNDPADIPALLDVLAPDVDAVCGVRRKRLDTTVRRISSRVANGFRNAVTGDKLADAGCGFRAMRRNVIVELPAFNGIHRFLPTVLRYQGFRVIEVPIGHRPRTWGQSKYGIGNRMVRGMVDCLAMRWWKRRVICARRVMQPA